MAKKIEPREAEIDQMTDLDALRARLKAAEKVCVLASWSQAPDRKWARGRLEYRYWSEWYAMADNLAHRKANPEIHADRKNAEDEDRKHGFYRKATA